ncbi:hypothetical protein C923_00929 [Plasmodium falciparum UGT5.1]|uniref:Uncharacterized protein n=3 Tax=Plasmodium falciparum TaxID=5833 RepID=A0A024WD58_PLAFA|nr:hypothetical protein PFTANZ_00933 [Plasmodium falciparum Tanzania (2000708)]ETW63213.1 hypothetical protein PFMC_00859 [Plasmodium falciparum CAMP/Malaysia]EWC78395.1 hypothetical protein C923_00929 [Plasmodium falciparum UGT5.1]
MIIVSIRKKESNKTGKTEKIYNINVLCHLCPITIKYASLLNLVSSLCSHKLYYFFFLILIKEYDEYSNKNTNIHLCSLPNNSFIKMKEKNSYETYKKKNS